MNYASLGVLASALLAVASATFAPAVPEASERHPMGSGLAPARVGFPVEPAVERARDSASAIEAESRRVAGRAADAAAARAAAADAVRRTLDSAALAVAPLHAPQAEFSERRGTLLLPIYYRPIARFGDRRDSRTGTSERHTGWSWGRTGEVVAATDGVVLRTALVAGWGSIVIVGHGDSAHTVYAQLTQIGVRRGDVVARGDALGAVDAVYDDASTLYFELRIRGIPVDPAPWWRL